MPYLDEKTKGVSVLVSKTETKKAFFLFF